MATPATGKRIWAGSHQTQQRPQRPTVLAGRPRPKVGVTVGVGHICSVPNVTVREGHVPHSPGPAWLAFKQRAPEKLMASGGGCT